MPSRTAFHDFLKEEHLDPKLASISPSRHILQDGQMLGSLIASMNEGDENAADAFMGFIQQSLDNLNAEIETYHDVFRKQMQLRDYTLPDNVYAGTLSTGLLCARAKKWDPGYLIIIDSGCFPLLETACWLTWVNLSCNVAAEILAEVVKNYCDWEANAPMGTPAPRKPVLDYEATTGATMKPSSLDFLMRRVLDFIVCHEYAHLYKGHVSNHGEVVGVVPHQSVHVNRHIPNKEVAADIWSLNAIVGCFPEDYDDAGRECCCLGPVIFMGMWHLIEHSRFLNGQPRDGSYPTAYERFSVIFLVYALHGLYEHTFLSRKFSGILAAAYELLFDEPLIDIDTDWNVCRHIQDARGMYSQKRIHEVIDGMNDLADLRAMFDPEETHE